jgi:hypothetical protein
MKRTLIVALIDIVAGAVIGGTIFYFAFHAHP